MRIIPVLDLMGGLVVRGLAGRRAEYRPIVSSLTSSCQPVDVARAIKDRFGLREMYLADLDAIAGAAPALATFAALQALDIQLWVDCGIQDAAAALRLASSGVSTIVVGLETIAGPVELARICAELGARRIVFSLDLQENKPLGDLSGWEEASSLMIARQAVALGVERLLILDLARVGTGSGTGTEDLCRDLASCYPHLEIVAGGGVHDQADLRRLQKLGVRAALVASALHDGRIKLQHLEAL